MILDHSPGQDNRAPAWITPRDYQQHAIDATFAAWQRGVNRVLIALPTGAGKTVIFAMIAEQFIAQQYRVLVLAHRDELINQAVDKLRDVLGPDIEIGIVKAEADETDAQIVVASVQTLARERRLERIRPNFALVVVDEAHHAAAESYRRILTHLNCFHEKGPQTLGVTATPDRGDGVGLQDVFQEIVFERSILDLMSAGYLVDLTAKQVAIQADFAGLHTRAGDFIDGETGAALMEADAPATIARAYREFAGERKGICFTPTVAVAHAMAEAFVDVGIRAAAVDATTPTRERRALLHDLATGTIQVVPNCGVLTEGFDEPSVSCITIAKPTKSRGHYTQMIGRGTRPYPGKTDCLILDTVGATTRHDLMTAAELFGLPLESLKTKSVSEAVASLDGTVIPTAIGGKLVAASVDLFRQRAAHWVATRTGRFVLPTGDGTLVLRPQFGDHWDVLHVPRGAQPIILAEHLTLGFAQGLAEEQVRVRGAQILVSRDAAWRREPPTTKQRYLLRCLGVSSKGITTKGEASDAISAAQAAEVA